jgi:hypothetical protein
VRVRGMQQRNPQALVWIVTVGLVLGCRGASSVRVEQTAVVDAGQPDRRTAGVPAPEARTCMHFFDVSPRIVCGFTGHRTDEKCSDGSRLRLDTYGDGSRSVPGEYWFEAPLAKPLFAAAFGPEDLCTSAAAPPGSLAVTCLGPKGKPFTVRARAEGSEVLVESEQEPPRRLTAPPGSASACPRLVQTFGLRDLAPLQLAYRNGSPSRRCASTPGSKRSVPVTFDTTKLPGDEARVRITVPGAGTRDLGILANTGGGCEATRYTDVRGMRLLCTDMGVETRLAYQLGDALYVTTAPDRIERIELPCDVEVELMRPALATSMEERTFGD